MLLPAAYGGLVAWGHFLERCGVIVELAACDPQPRTNPNGTAVIETLKTFLLKGLVGGTRFAHGRRLQDDMAVATITRMGKGCLSPGSVPAASLRGRSPQQNK